MNRIASGALVLGVLAGGCAGPSAVCSSDDDCVAVVGPDSVCVFGDRAEGLCTDGTWSVDETEPPVRDAGPDPVEDAGPEALSIVVELSDETVPANTEVTLAWTASSAVSCTAEAQARYANAPEPITDAPTTAVGEARVGVTQDTTFIVTCSDFAGKRESESTTVDVQTSGSLTAEEPSVNAGAAVTLVWNTFGATACALHDEGGALVYQMAAAELPVGQTTVPADGARFSLRCDDLEVDAVDLTLASVGVVTATPSALGPDPADIELAWDYDGPGSCSVSVGEGGVAEPDVGAAGLHELTLTEPATVVVTCDGHGEPLITTVEVPRVITSFTGPATALDWGSTAPLSVETVAGASCAFFDASTDAAVSDEPLPTATTTYRAECTLPHAEGDKRASATTVVAVRPAAPTVWGEMVPAYSAEGLYQGARLVVLAETSPNAERCQLEPSVGNAIELAIDPSAPAAKLFSARFAAADFSGHVSFAARCFTDGDTLEASSTDVARAWFGVVNEAADLAGLGQATYLLGGVTLVNDANVTSLAGLANVRQLGGNLQLQQLNHTSFTDLSGLALERVVGDVDVSDNVYLQSVGFDSPVSPSSDQGLAWLEDVEGSLRIEENASLTAVTLPRLTRVGDDFTLRGNAALERTAQPALALVVGTLTIDDSPLLTKGPSGSEGFPALTEAGHLIVKRTGLSALSSYFPALATLESMEVSFNSALNCTTLASQFYCGFADPRPSPAVSNNEGGCGWASVPTCP